MKIKRGEDPGLVSVKGFSGVILEVVEFQPDLNSPDWPVRPICHMKRTPANMRNPPNPLAAVCKVVAGNAPTSWEICTPWGHYRVSVKNLRKITTLEALAAV